MIQLMPSNRAMRMNMARKSPIRRALFWTAGFSLPVKMEINTILSIPRTISRQERVKKATRFSRVKISIKKPPM